MLNNFDCLHRPSDRRTLRAGRRAGEVWQQAGKGCICEATFNKPDYPCEILSQFPAFTMIVKLYVWLQTVRKLVFALLVCLCFMVVEFCGGYFTHRQRKSAYDLLHIAQIVVDTDSVYVCSLALMTDAAHLLSDVTGFAVAAVASHLASQKSARTYSFGSVMAAHY